MNGTQEHDVDLERRWPPQCDRCGKRLTYLTGCIEIVDFETKRYPNRPQMGWAGSDPYPELHQPPPRMTLEEYFDRNPLVAAVAQTVCNECDAAGYLISFPELLLERFYERRGWRAWAHHLHEKVWAWRSMDIDLADLAVVAERLRAEHRALYPNALMPSAGYRPPRNPRAITAKLRALIFERDAFTCRRCGKKAPVVEIVIDHIIPVAKGGTADEHNLQTLCVDCNAGKSDSAPHPHDLSAGKKRD